MFKKTKIKLLCVLLILLGSYSLGTVLGSLPEKTIYTKSLDDPDSSNFLPPIEDEPVYARISGYVKDKASDVGIAGATVKIYRDNDLEDTDITDNNGHYSFYPQVTDVTYRIEVSADCFFSQEKNIIVESRDTWRDYINGYCNFYLLKQVKIFGSVENEISHVGISGATVEIWEDGELLKTDTTDVDGKYSFYSLATDVTYKINVIAHGYISDERSISVDLISTTEDYISVSCNFLLSTPEEKHAFFLYDSTTLMNVEIGGFGISTDIIEDYQYYLELEGFDSVTLYNCDDFTSQSSVSAVFDEIEGIEDENDLIIIVIAGHGYYFTNNDAKKLSNLYPNIEDYSRIEQENDYNSVLDRNNNGYYSWVTLNPVADVHLTSDYLDYRLDQFDSTNVMTIVESCHSGGFYGDTKSAGRCIITSTDIENAAKALQIDEMGLGDPLITGEFIHNFFKAGIYERGYNLQEAYNYAEENLTWILEEQEDPNKNQDPLKYDQTTYFGWFDF